MRIYHYHTITNELTSESIARESPLEKDIFFIPAFATDKKPPKKIEGKTIIFESDEWKYVNVEDVAKIDIDNTSPSTDTAFKKVEKTIKNITDEISEIKTKFDKIDNLEEKITELEQKNLEEVTI
jgi:hypothetical protein